MSVYICTYIHLYICTNIHVYFYLHISTLAISTDAFYLFYDKKEPHTRQQMSMKSIKETNIQANTLRIHPEKRHIYSYKPKTIL